MCGCAKPKVGMTVSGRTLEFAQQCFTLHSPSNRPIHPAERSAATEQARRSQDRLKAQQARLEETSRSLALRLNRQVAYRSLQWRQREAIQEQLDRLGALVRALPTRARRKH